MGNELLGSLQLCIAIHSSESNAGHDVHVFSVSLSSISRIKFTFYRCVRTVLVDLRRPVLLAYAYDAS